MFALAAARDLVIAIAIAALLTGALGGLQKRVARGAAPSGRIAMAVCDTRLPIERCWAAFFGERR